MELIIELRGERFRVERRPGAGSVTYDYTWLSGPNQGYGFSLSGPLGDDRAAHLERVGEFLDGIDPETGFLADS